MLSMVLTRVDHYYTKVGIYRSLRYTAVYTMVAGSINVLNNTIGFKIIFRSNLI